jgi:DNA repair protein RecN (Recombination protein N)
MLKSLCIHNLATIENIELALKPGFTIFTGETGAGKSILIDGIRLILGEKGSKEMIRTGEKQISVEAIFLSRQATLFSNKENSEIFVQRILSGQGSGRGYFNGTLVPVKVLKERGNDLVDIYGQNDHVFLRKTENQLDYLDLYAETMLIRQEIELIAQELRRILREKCELENKEKERVQRLDFLQFQITEIEEAGLLSGEDEDILQERNILKNAEKINNLISESLNLSYDRENSILPQLSRLQEIIRELGEYHSFFNDIQKNMDQLSITVRELSDFLVTFKEKQSSSPEKLESIEERLSQIEKLKRKYGANINEILIHLEKCKSEQEDLSHSQEKLDELEISIREKTLDYYKIAEILRAERIKNARKLEQDIEREISFLGMTKAKVKIDIILMNDILSNIKDKGTEDVEFLISPNPGEDLKPLRKIASGGELSRIMLALKSIGKEKGYSKTLIFDEIDSGIGGKIADFVALKLKSLAKENQVICITHLPQIASYAEHHYRIDKTIKNERTYTTITKLTLDERVEEIARLISGSHVTTTSCQNAREMLEQNASSLHKE